MPVGLACNADDVLSIAVLCGGSSPEREVSLAGGKRIADALGRLGHRAAVVDLNRESAHQLLAMAPDLVYNALHGGQGEDGCASGLLDILGLAYTHSRVAASSVGMDKVLTKHVLKSLGIDFPEFSVLTKEEVLSAKEVMPYPFVIKPICGGSTIGVHAIFSRSEYLDLSVHADALEGRMLVEEYIPGQEVHTAVFLGRAIGTMEFLFEGRVYGYDAKYVEGLCRHVFPANLSDDVYSLTMEWAVKLYQCLGCRTVSRVDFRYDKANKALKLLEINTHPGMTACSALPEILWLRCGLDFDQVVDFIVKDALCGDDSCREHVDALMKRRPAYVQECHG
ncbi:D-alanine--D-alanine ligase [Anaplasma centrale str. Israel]|nr:D-alanine--D-alanine ligase [Anaplasma centrale]ACZ49553.1 D-alanine--D-alanine ligase [Anaplasma centrale str. Israel]